jgi:sigma-B regulation protein RsbU (phosphoserine phosphatase)
MAEVGVRTAAYEVQRRLLSPAPDVAGAEFAVSWQPFGEVSGDFYDFSLLEEGSVGITLGDVSGKGYDAALLMGFALAHIRAGLRHGLRLPFIMADVDELLREYSSIEKYAETMVAILTPARRRLVFVQGGGIYPIVYRARSDKLFLYSGASYRIPGFPVLPGAPARKTFVEESIDLGDGDLVLVFSDGVSQREGADNHNIVHQDDFGAFVAPSITEICRHHCRDSAKNVLAAFKEFLDNLGTPRDDDETIIVVKSV